MSGLFERDYTSLTSEEICEMEKINAESPRVAGAKFGRKNFFHRYPKAVRHYMHLFPNNYLDVVDLKNCDELEKQCDGFENLLNDKSIKETDIQRYIKKNRYYHIPASIFNRFNFGHHEAYLFKEFSLGTSFIADYVLVGKSSNGYEFIFVELENPYGNITIADGDFGDTIRKGINQINDWDGFIASNFSSITAEFKKHTTYQLSDEFYSFDATRIHYVVVAGRRDDFNDKMRKLRRLSEKRDNILILHYDNLLDDARDLIGSKTY